jgi:hypothetical protein
LVLIIDSSATRAMRARHHPDRHPGIDSASAGVEENVMTDAKRRDMIDPTDTIDDAARDPGRHSTWNTIDGTVDVDDVIAEDELEDFLVEPISDPLAPAAIPDVAEELETPAIRSQTTE